MMTPIQQALHQIGVIAQNFYVFSGVQLKHLRVGWVIHRSGFAPIKEEAFVLGVYEEDYYLPETKLLGSKRKHKRNKIFMI